MSTLSSPPPTSLQPLQTQITHLTLDLTRTEHLLADRLTALELAEQRVKGLKRKEEGMRRRLEEQEKAFEIERTHLNLLLLTAQTAQSAQNAQKSQTFQSDRTSRKSQSDRTEPTERPRPERSERSDLEEVLQGSGRSNLERSRRGKGTLGAVDDGDRDGDDGDIVDSTSSSSSSPSPTPTPSSPTQSTQPHNHDPNPNPHLLPKSTQPNLSLSLSSQLTTLHSELVNRQDAFNHQLLLLNSELAEQRAINERLREENVVWEGLVGDRTLEGGIGLGLGVGLGVGVGAAGGNAGPDSIGRSTWRISRREKGKSLADELQGFDLVGFGRGLEVGSTTGAVAATTTTAASGEEAVEREEEGQERETETDRMKRENEELKLELKQLVEANRGLRLYCSKILDKILIHSDSEQFLADVSSSDPTTSRKIPVRPRPPSARPISSSSRRPRSAVFPRSGSEEYVVPVVQADPKTGLRPLSMLAGNVVGKDRGVVAAPEPRKAVEQVVETSTEKRARRGLSLNWGPFTTFGGSASVPSPRTENVPESMIPSPEPRAMSVSPAPSFSGGRKLQTHEEDDEDRVERERMAATMKLMGLDPTSPRPSLVVPEASSVDMQRSNSAQSQVSASNSETSLPYPRPARPISRWSSFFSRSPAATESPSLASPNPNETTPITTADSPVLGDLAETVKQAHEQRKREERETLRTSKREPPRSVMDIMTARHRNVEPPKTHVTRPSVDSMGSLEEMRHPIAAGLDEHEPQIDRKPRGSVSTLFDASVHEH